MALKVTSAKNFSLEEDRRAHVSAELGKKVLDVIQQVEARLSRAAVVPTN